MKRHIFPLIVFIVMLAACATRHVPPKPVPLLKKPVPPEKTVYQILEENVPAVAKKYLGKHFRMGANPDKTEYSDCSNLVCAITRNSLPGSDYYFKQFYFHTADMIENSYPIKRSDTGIGDMVFFNKSKGGIKVNHVGMIVQKKPIKFFFIHASKSKGVIVTSTESDSWKFYWKERFNSFRRWRKEVFGEKKNL